MILQFLRIEIIFGARQGKQAKHLLGMSTKRFDWLVLCSPPSSRSRAFISTLAGFLGFPAFL